MVYLAVYPAAIISICIKPEGWMWGYADFSLCSWPKAFCPDLSNACAWLSTSVASLSERTGFTQAPYLRMWEKTLFTDWHRMCTMVTTVTTCCEPFKDGHSEFVAGISWRIYSSFLLQACFVASMLVWSEKHIRLVLCTVHKWLVLSWLQLSEH